MTARSVLLVASDDCALVTAVRETVEPHGWSCAAFPEDAELSVAMAVAPAVVVVDQRSRQAPSLIAAIRSMAAPANGTPILTVGDADRGAAGSGGQLHLPLDPAALLALLRQWAGPIEDHALRSEPWHFRYRLLRLLGLDEADAMLARLRDSLSEAVERGQADGTAIAAHRLAGLAGICGFGELCQALSRVDRHEAGALAAAIDQSRLVIAQLDAALMAT